MRGWSPARGGVIGYKYVQHGNSKVSLIAFTVSSCSQQELRARLEALTEQAAASSAVAAQLQAQQQRQQAHWEGVVHDLKVPTLPPLPLY